MTLRTQARFPSVGPDEGHYESFYLKASDSPAGRAVWIRHTVHQRPGRPPTCAVWLTYFDIAATSPRAAKAQFDARALSAPDVAYVRVGESELGPGWAHGALSVGGLDATWRLRFTDRHEALRHLPAEWMYRRRLPRTKILSPHPAALFEGTLDLDGQRIQLEGWPGMVGHNWGAEHAEEWVWLQAAEPDGAAAGDYVDLAAGRIKLGRWTTPWLANGAVVLDGTRYRLGGLGRVRSTEIDAEPNGCRFVVSGEGVTISGSVRAPKERFVAWVYSDPSGGGHQVLNCSISDFEATVRRANQAEVGLRLEDGGVYELGTHHTDHGVPVQPFVDG